MIRISFGILRAAGVVVLLTLMAQAPALAPTPGVRNFAEQIEHVVVGNVNLIASGIDADRTSLGIEKEAYLTTKPS